MWGPQMKIHLVKFCEVFLKNKKLNNIPQNKRKGKTIAIYTTVATAKPPKVPGINHRVVRHSYSLEVHSHRVASKVRGGHHRAAQSL